MTYKRLTESQRYAIEIGLKRGFSQKEIAQDIEVHPSTVSRELKRNSKKKTYHFKFAQNLSEKRKEGKHPVPILSDQNITDKLLHALQEQWSPQQISGRFLKNYRIRMSHETIYSFIWKDKKQGGTLFQNLRHGGKKYNKRGAKNAGRGCIPNRKDISERPKIVDKKTEVGHFEGDLIIGKDHKSALLTLVDKTTKVTFIRKVTSKQSQHVRNKICKSLMPLKSICKTITFDNGKEFAEHEKMKELLGVQVFFARPYHSWERGLNEHTNGLIRQYYPKKTDFNEVDSKEIKMLERKLNERPRKSLSYLTPREIFLQKTGFDLYVH